MGEINNTTYCREEREWREWVDQKLVHVLPPNIYRTPKESLQSFEYMSRVGNFSAVERVAAKYCGAISMYFISKMLKKRYKLKEDVRQSLYEFCDQWMKGIGKDRKFMGGDRPNLADLVREYHIHCFWYWLVYFYFVWKFSCQYWPFSDNFGSVLAILFDWSSHIPNSSPKNHDIMSCSDMLS